MNRIDAVFAELKKKGKKGFIPYFTAGYPDRETFLEILHAAAEAGSAVIEVGMPFSDPIADGPIIQASSEAALKGGVTLDAILEMVRSFRASRETPIVLMGYLNPILHRGFENFVDEAKAAGADGLIIPDLPPEEADELIAAARERDLATIFLAAPTSTDERLAIISRASTGYLYLVTRLGVTGIGETPSDNLGALVHRLRAHTKLPIAAGFGISRVEHVRAVCRHADAAIVGSALVRLITKNLGKPDLAAKVGDLCRKLA